MLNVLDTAYNLVYNFKREIVLFKDFNISYHNNKTDTEAASAKNPEVSIITPVYNGQQYIQSAVKCVLTQSYSDFEWIIIDDCSTDQTNNILMEVKRQDGRIVLISLDKNMGPVYARNAGLKTAKGRFVAFLDIDDIWMPKKLEIQIKQMKEKGYALSYTGYRKFSTLEDLNDGRIISIPKKVTAVSMKKTCSIMASSAVFDTKQTGNILQDTSVLYKDDLHLWLRILDLVKEGHGIQQDLARLRIHGDSFTGNKLKEAWKQWKFYRVSLGLNFLKSLYYFCHYAIAGTIKYLR